MSGDTYESGGLEGDVSTTIFYILGSVMFVGALVVLVTNKRMRSN